MIRLTLSAIAFALLVASAIAGGTVPFHARGTEPFWSVELTDAAITFMPMDGTAVTVRPVPAPRKDGNADVYEAKAGGKRFALRIADKVCTNAMSGMPFPKTVAVALGTDTFTGCGGEPAKLLQADWVIIEIDGKPTVAGSAPTVKFEPGGEFNGSASCNRFFGGYSLSGEGLTTNGLGSSMMMCEQTMMDQEMNVMGVLKGLAGFSIGDDGALILRANDGRTIKARRAA